jgi:hypothetical protein
MRRLGREEAELQDETDWCVAMQRVTVLSVQADLVKFSLTFITED